MSTMVVQLYTVLIIVSSIVLCTAQLPCSLEGGYDQFATVKENDAEIGKEIKYLKFPATSSEATFRVDYNEYFAFNTITHWVWINGTIDAEVDNERQVLTITCIEGLGMASVEINVRITIEDVNDNGPVFTKDEYTLMVGEMIDVTTILQTTIFATDADVAAGNNQITYSILDGPYADYFAIQSGYFEKSNPKSPTLQLLRPLDFEELPTFRISVMARDDPISGRQFNSTCVVEIVVQDEDDQNPVFNSSVYQAVITDTSSLNSVVDIRPRIAAYDPDKSLNVKVSYSFHDPKGQSGALLAIDPDTAEVTLTNAPTAKEVYLLLQATQTDNPSRYGVALLAVQVQGSNVNAPVFNRDNVQLVRTESFPVGEVIATVFATDDDPASFVTYSLDEDSKANFDLDPDTGEITLRSPLNFANKPEHVIRVTASDGALQTSSQVTIKVVSVNNKPPVILTPDSDLNVSVGRKKGIEVTTIAADDDGQGASALTFKILTYSNLFGIDNQGKITVRASPDDLEHDVYQVAVIVQDNGQPSHSAITAVTVNFPKILTPLVGAQMAESDDILPMVLGAVAAVLLIILIILIVYICKRRVREKEHLDRAKKQVPSRDAKALAFKKQGTLGRQARANIEFGEDPSDGDTTVQENPLSSAGKGGYYNFGQVYSDDTDTNTEVDMSEIHVETSVTPYANMPTSNDDNNNDNIYNHSQMSEESEDYGPSDKQAITSFFRNGSLSTYRDSSDSELSLNTSPTDSHDSKKNLVVPSSLARSRVPEEELSNGGHALSGGAHTANLDPDSSVVPASQKQELTVYF